MRTLDPAERPTFGGGASVASRASMAGGTLPIVVVSARDKYHIRWRLAGDATRCARLTTTRCVWRFPCVDVFLTRCHIPRRCDRSASVIATVVVTQDTRGLTR
jgi:hypothetical protein